MEKDAQLVDHRRSGSIRVDLGTLVEELGRGLHGPDNDEGRPEHIDVDNFTCKKELSLDFSKVAGASIYRNGGATCRRSTTSGSSGDRRGFRRYGTAPGQGGKGDPWFACEKQGCSRCKGRQRRRQRGGVLRDLKRWRETSLDNVRQLLQLRE